MLLQLTADSLQHYLSIPVRRRACSTLIIIAVDFIDRIYQKNIINILHLSQFLDIIWLSCCVSLFAVPVRHKARRFYESSVHDSVGQSVRFIHSVPLLPFSLSGLLASDPVRYGHLGHGSLRCHRFPHQFLHGQELPEIPAEGPGRSFPPEKATRFFQ